MAGRHGALARRAAGLVRAGVDSPMESRLRMLLVLAGLPEPVVNHIEYDESGRWLRRYDLSYPDQRLAIEYDGRQHADSTRQWERDVERREELDQDDWRIVVVLAKGIYREPDRTLERVVDAMASRGIPGASHVGRVAAALRVTNAASIRASDATNRPQNRRSRRWNPCHVGHGWSGLLAV